MKTIKTDLYSIIGTEDHIIKALEFAARYKHQRIDVKKALAHPKEVVSIIRDILGDDDFVFIPTKKKFVSNRILKKDRWIVVPDFIKQVFHHVIMLAIKGDFINTIYLYSVGSLPDRGIILGKIYLAKIIKKLKGKPFYCLKCDIKKFFESIPIDLLKAKLAKRYRDKKFLKQIYKILDDNVFIQDGTIDSFTGIPIGFYTSQWFANWYLSDLDHYIKNELQIKTYMRYVDDLVIIDTDKNKLHKVRQAIQDFLVKEGLELKGNYQVFKVCDYNEKGELVTYRPIDVLGFKFYHDKTVLRRCVFLKSKRKVARIVKKKRLTYLDAQAIMSYVGYYKYTDCEYAFHKYVTSKISLKACREIISRYAKKKNKEEKEKLELLNKLSMEVV